MDFNQIQELIRLVGKSKLSEFIYKQGDVKIIIRNQQNGDSAPSVQPTVFMPAAVQPMVAQPPAAMPAPAAAPKSEAPASAAEKPAAPASEAKSNYLIIKSPMVGTFFLAADPSKPPFVSPGKKVDIGTTVCIIEAMKLFNEIESDVKGTIVRALVENGKAVDYDTPLFEVDPS